VRVGASVFPCGVLLYGSIFPSINTMIRSSPAYSTKKIYTGIVF
jgi:hypothetical protein